MMLLMCQSIQGRKHSFKTQISSGCVKTAMRFLIERGASDQVFSAAKSFFGVDGFLYDRDSWTQNTIKISSDQSTGQSLGRGGLGKVIFKNVRAMKQKLRQQLLPKRSLSLYNWMSNRNQLVALNGLRLAVLSFETERLLGLVESAWTNKMKIVFKQKESLV